MDLAGRRRTDVVGHGLSVGSPRVEDDSRRQTRLDAGMYYIGTVIFIALAILCVVAFLKVKKRDDEYGRGQ